MSTAQHRAEAPNVVRVAVVTVSDTRNKETDQSGRIIIDLLEAAEHVNFEVRMYEIVPDDADQIVNVIRYVAKHPNSFDAVLINGGTGIAGRDHTFEAIDSLLEKRMPGFGEIFRMLSFTEDVGPAAILSRATAGIYRRMAVFSMPGSTGAVTLAMKRLILPELAHVVREVRKDRVTM